MTRASKWSRNQKIALATPLVAALGALAGYIGLYKPSVAHNIQNQIKSTGSATTSGPSSPAVTGGTNTFNYGEEKSKSEEKPSPSQNSLKELPPQQTVTGNNNNTVIGNGNSVGKIYNAPKLSGWLIPRSDPTPSVECVKYDTVTHTAGGRAPLQIPKDHVALLVGASAFVEEDFPRTILQLADVPRLIADRKDGKISVSLDIFDSDPNPRIIAKIESNKFTVNPNNYFKSELSSDGSRLRIIDQHDIEVLNVDYFNKNALRIRAVLYFPGINGPLRISDDGIAFEDRQESGNCFGDNPRELPEINIFPSKTPKKWVMTIER